MKIQTAATGIVLDIDHFAVHDGPGIRTCVYLKGCPLHCTWCHSPESQSMPPQVLFAANRCTYCGACISACVYDCQNLDRDLAKRTFLHDQCNDCGDCVTVCPSGALFIAGKRMSADDVINELLSDRVFFRNSGGGVTLSGGEVLMQAGFADRILRGLKVEGIHTIVETSGYGSKQDLLMLAESADTFYYDYKLGDKDQFFFYTGGNLDVVLNNLASLREKTAAIVLRIPLIPGITDSEENVMSAYQTAKALGIKAVHLLPYNASAGAKYEWCGRKYELGEMHSDMDYIEQMKQLAPTDIEVQIMN